MIILTGTYRRSSLDPDCWVWKLFAHEEYTPVTDGGLLVSGKAMRFDLLVQDMQAAYEKCERTVMPHSSRVPDAETARRVARHHQNIDPNEVDARGREGAE